MPQLKTAIAGVNFRKGATQYLKDLTAQYESEKAAANAPVILFRLEREPDNKYDQYAIKVSDPAWNDPSAEGGFLGYIPKDWSYEIARIMDNGTPVECEYRGKHTVMLFWEEEDQGAIDNGNGAG